MRLHLQRFTDFGDGGMIGRVQVTPAWECWSMEAPWRDNERFISCIPAGLYHLERHQGGKYRDTWAIVGNGVAHWETPDCDRYTCVLHAAKFARHLKGCVSFGLSLSLEGGVPLLGSPGAAHRHVMNHLGVGGDGLHELLIEDKPGGWET